MTRTRMGGRPTVLTIVVSAFLAGLSGHVRAQDQDAQEKDDGKPELTLRVTPRVGFSPVRVTAVARLDGGPDDYEEYYCAGVEWDWGDDTISEASQDCDPYEAGSSQIRRSFRGSHTFRESGQYEIRISLIRNGDTVAFTNASVDVRASLRERFP